MDTEYAQLVNRLVEVEQKEESAKEQSSRLDSCERDLTLHRRKEKVTQDKAREWYNHRETKEKGTEEWKMADKKFFFYTNQSDRHSTRAYHAGVDVRSQREAYQAFLRFKTLREQYTIDVEAHPEHERRVYFSGCSVCRNESPEKRRLSSCYSIVCNDCAEKAVQTAAATGEETMCPCHKEPVEFYPMYEKPNDEHPRECIVCFQPNPWQRMIAPCGHIMCRACANRLGDEAQKFSKKPDCPTCRKVYSYDWLKEESWHPSEGAPSQHRMNEMFPTLNSETDNRPADSDAESSTPSEGRA